MEDRLHAVEEPRVVEEASVGENVDDSFLKDVLLEAVEVERYFGEMDRKKAAIMQQLSD